MYIKPKRRGGFKQFSDYLQGNAGNENDNEAVNFISSSTSLTDINKFCIFASDIAEPKRGGKYPLKNPIEHVSIRTRQGEILTPEMIQGKIPELLKKLGYQDCPWILVQHLKKQKNGAVEPHYHLGICRVDKNGKIPNPKSWDICEELANKFAREFGWKPAFAGANGNRFKQEKDHLARLWTATEKLSPADRLKKFQQAGFTAARGDRGQLLFVDRSGKPHSLHRIPALKEKGLKQADFPAAFGFDGKKMATLPTLRAAQRNIGRIHNVRRTTNKIIRTFGKVGRIYKNALSPLRSRADVGNRWGASGIALLAVLWGLSRLSQCDELRQVRGTGGGNRKRKRKLNPAPDPAPRPRHVRATRGWWVGARAAGVYKSMIAAGYTAEQAEKAVDLVYLEEEQRLEAEQRYLDWLHGYDPKRGELAANKQQAEPMR
ncbi:MAG: hypothetical protein WCD70_04645 [Alphaproteobacteria bacterium]